MNLRAVDLNLFPVFEAIYSERSLTRAGETLNMTQPAVSNALSRLRAAFGDPLFVRSGRGMTPTPAAEALAQPVREALLRLRSGLDQQMRFDPKTASRTFRVSMRDTAASMLLPPLASALESEAPHVCFQSVLFDRAEIPHSLATGQLDFAIDVSALARPELAHMPLISDRYVCVLREGHPATKRQLTLKRFLELRHVTVSSRVMGRGLVDLALGLLGEEIEPAMRTMHFQPAFHAVMASDLALVAPLSLARRYDVAWRELPVDAPTLDLLLFWRRDTTDDPALRWAREKLLEAAQRHD